jgi:queuine tRNA-ribosyltransferase/7-cyano-7-deazaguanine tRNA-ribosyltransferase
VIKFKVLKKSSKSKARLGLIETEHGVVETPALVPVATQATVKTLTSEEAVQTGSQILICNTFHLHLKPGEKIVKAGGGLHKFMNWKKPLMTDSAGYQVFSLGFGSDHGVGKMLSQKDKRSIELGQQPSKVKITEDGVQFNSPVDGSKVFIGPKESIKIQEQLGADIIFAFDECTSPLADRNYTKKSLEKTHDWAQKCLNYKKTNQALYGIVQGGKFKDLRIQSAKYIGGLPFDGFGIGGEFGDNKKIMTEMIDWVLPELPEEKPRHLLGIGKLEDIVEIIKAGIDTFDCIVPTHYARHGTAFTSAGKIDMTKIANMKSQLSLDKKCDCFVCKTYTRSYLCHLLRAKELTALKLLTFHNLYFFNKFVSKIRDQIRNGKF